MQEICKKKYQNALAILRAFRTKPDIFLTVTVNADWPEVTKAIQKLGRNPKNHERDDVIATVFKKKLTEILDDILKKHVLGVMVAHVYVIEFQKRGLPHAHCLLILHPDCKLDKKPELYDQIITAQIPDPERYPKAHALFANIKFMVHVNIMGIVFETEFVLNFFRNHFNHKHRIQQMVMRNINDYHQKKAVLHVKLYIVEMKKLIIDMQYLQI